MKTPSENSLSSATNDAASVNDFSFAAYILAVVRIAVVRLLSSHHIALGEPINNKHLPDAASLLVS